MPHRLASPWTLPGRPGRPTQAASCAPPADPLPYQLVGLEVAGCVAARLNHLWLLHLLILLLALVRVGRAKPARSRRRRRRWRRRAWPAQGAARCPSAVHTACLPRHVTAAPARFRSTPAVLHLPAPAPPVPIGVLAQRLAQHLRHLLTPLHHLIRVILGCRVLCMRGACGTPGGGRGLASGTAWPAHNPQPWVAAPPAAPAAPSRGSASALPPAGRAPATKV